MPQTPTADALLDPKNDYVFFRVFSEEPALLVDLINVVRRDEPAIVEVSLTDLRTGTPVEGAVIFATRMDMAPDGMETMTSPVTAMSAETPGNYRFATDITMAGGWRFSIAAKVQGEEETVETQIELKATP